MRPVWRQGARLTSFLASASHHSCTTCSAATTAAATFPPAPCIFTRGAHRMTDADAVWAKRERRKQRRAANRELKERVQATHSFGWHCSRKGADRASAVAGTETPSMLGDDWDLFRAVLGKPRTRSEQRKFARAWKHWQAAGAPSEHGDDASNTRESTSSAGWCGTSPSASSHGSSEHGSGHSRHSSSWRGTAGNSAGPRWGQADWTWADMRQEQQRAAGFAGMGDEEAWYEPPRGRSAHSSGGSSSGTSGSGGAWGWHRAWEHFGFGFQQGHSSAGGRRAWQHGGGIGGTAAHGWCGLLGLERSWLSSRCGRALKQAYLAKARALHPDLHASGGAVSAAAAEARFKEVQAAYESLLALVARPGGQR